MNLFSPLPNVERRALNLVSNDSAAGLVARERKRVLRPNRSTLRTSPIERTTRSASARDTPAPTNADDIGLRPSTPSTTVTLASSANWDTRHNVGRALAASAGASISASPGESAPASSRSAPLPDTDPAIDAAVACADDRGEAPVARKTANAPRRAAPPAIASATRAFGGKSFTRRALSLSWELSEGALAPAPG